MSQIDDEIRSVFEELRADEVARAPEFRAMWRSATAVSDSALLRKRPRRVLGWMAAAAAILVTATVLANRSRNTAPAAAIADVSAGILYWRSPTDGLLRMSQQSMPASPSILESVLDGVITPSIPRESFKGAKGK
jgi:hypothetical protein